MTSPTKTMRKKQEDSVENVQIHGIMESRSRSLSKKSVKTSFNTRYR